MKILSVNAGSSSLKFTLFEMPTEKELISGYFERVGLPHSFYTITLNGEKIKTERKLTDHRASFEIVVKELIEKNIIKELDEIKGIGHRIVQGGAYFNGSVLATPKHIKIVEDLVPLAPLHNPPALIGLKCAKEVFPKAAQCLVFDTAFHQTMNEREFIYPVPYEWYTKYKVRKYGFHGTSHKYVSLRTKALLGKKNIKLIICHLGSGASIAAIKDGKCVDTSMGLTPNAGLMMGTRSGDIDVTILPFIMNKTGLDHNEIDNILNKKSGLLGVSGVSSDSRDIEEGIKNGDARCQLAQDMFVKSIVGYIAKYYVELGGCDALIFTAGIGENGILTRKEIIEKLACLGFQLDPKANNTRSQEIKISSDQSSVPVYVIPTNEELMIAVDTYNLVK